MTLLGKNDGANAADGSSYLELVSLIRKYGATPKKDLLELWKRIVFNMAVSNTDDHLRNHGFVLAKEGWRWMLRQHLIWNLKARYSYAYTISKLKEIL